MRNPIVLGRVLPNLTWRYKSVAKSAISTSPESNASSTMPAVASTSVSTTVNGLLVNYLPEPTSMVYSVSADCDELSQEDQISPIDNETYAVRCQYNLVTGSSSQQSDSNGNSLLMVDIIGIVAYTLADCIRACSQRTRQTKLWGLPDSDSCRAVTFDTLLESATAGVGGNCWLKNGTADDSTKYGNCPVCISALRLD